ncbi:hypothetical protein [Adhaeribacter radiodurans]|uniref:Uncharacterized protein n=1 Tax=Adhaeribacter radiodurans TaxID=2745197 RepID=A0A7L7LDW3_9BACT|nr:hypothetical protein [Adhaeribacter radiodurans]QMU30947.1 hypothetical protein HUW48_24275 [Adhaeribacter radiodurans]
MDAYYVDKMAGKTEVELLEYFQNHQKYVPAAVLAAVNELQKRGRTFTEAELATLEPERQAVKQAALEEASENTEAEEAEEVPRLYTPSAILGFSVFFSLLFGGILLATNIRQIGNRRGSWAVIGFSLLFMFIEVVVMYQLKRSSTLTVAFNLAGAFILNYYFWPKYVGVQRPYEAKPIWRALLISILIVLPLIVIIALFPPQQ